jgi:hypothetical protein
MPHAPLEIVPFRSGAARGLASADASELIYRLLLLPDEVRTSGADVM